MNDQDKQLSKLLASASVHHLHLTLETLPVGQIEVCARGIITAIDEWAEIVLEYDKQELVGRNLKEILGEKSLLVMEKYKKNFFNERGDVSFKSSSGKTVEAVMTLIPTMESCKFVFNLVFTNLLGVD